MLKKLKAAFSSDESAPPPPATSAAASAATTRKAPAAPAVASSTPSTSSVQTAASAPCAAYLEKAKKKGVIVLANGALFEGTVDPNTRQPLQGTCTFPSGTTLEGTFDSVTGKFVRGTARFSSARNTLQSGEWCPVSTGEEVLNEGIGVRLAFGTLRDGVRRTVSIGKFDIYRKQWIRLSCGVRYTVTQSSPADHEYADQQPATSVISIGLFNVEKIHLRLGAMIAPTFTSAGEYWIDGGSNHLRSGISWNAATVFQGELRRRMEYDSGSCTLTQTGNRFIGTWRLGEGGQHLDFGIHIGYRTLGPASQEQEESSDNQNGLQVVQLGRFQPRHPRKLLTGHRVATEQRVFSEGGYCPMSGRLIVGTVFTNVPYRRNGAPEQDNLGPVAVAWLPNRELCAPENVVVMIPAVSIFSVPGFRSWSLPSIACTTEASVTQRISEFVGAAQQATPQGAAKEAAAKELPSLVAQETVELESAWYNGLDHVILSSGRGEVVFDDHIRRGSWTLLPAGDVSRATPVTWVDNFVEILQTRVHLGALDKVKGAGIDLSKHVILGEGFGGANPECQAAFPMRRSQWQVHHLDQNTYLTTTSAVSELRGVPMSMISACRSLYQETTSVPQLSDEDNASLDAALLSVESAIAPVKTSLGFVHVLDPVRRVSAEPESLRDRLASLPSLELGGEASTRERVEAHGLYVEAGRLAAAGLRYPGGTAEGTVRPMCELPQGTPPLPTTAPIQRQPMVFVARRYFSIKEQFMSSAFKSRFVKENAISLEISGSGVNEPVAAPPRRPIHLGPCLNIAVPLDVDCPQEYRQSWAFVLEYLHWVGLRHACVPFSLPQLPAGTTSAHFSQGLVDRFSSVQPSCTDLATILDDVLRAWDTEIEQCGHMVKPPFLPHTWRVSLAVAPLWPHGLLCRFVGEFACATAASAEVAMWLLRRHEQVVPLPAPWRLAIRGLLLAATKHFVADHDGLAASLFPVDPSTAEYADVHNCLYGMQFPITWPIVRLERVHNEELYLRYVQKRRAIGKECRFLEGQNGCNERRWMAHGTRGNDPAVIIRNGFDHRYSEKGLFGRAAYFAYDPVYSHTYRHETGNSKEAQFFLAAVTAGHIEMRDSVDKEIRHPKKGFHSVEGPLTDRFRGLMVYDLDQAYPSYLVTYSFA